MADAATIFNACPNRVDCPGSDYPVSNYSSEANDGPEFIFMQWPGNNGQITGSGGGGIPYCPPGSTLIDGECWSQVPGPPCPVGSIEINGQCESPTPTCPPGSIGIGESLFSLPDAQLCASLWSETCGNVSTFSFCTPPPWQYGNGNTPGVADGLFFNDAQSCMVVCANGSEFTYTIDAGRVANASKIMANRIAESLVCQYAQSQKVCLTRAPTPNNPGYNPLNLVGGSGFCCTGQHLTGDPLFAVTGLGEWVFSVSAGTLPTGTGLIQDTATTCAMAGTLDVPGIYNFTIQAANAFGQSVSQDFTIHLIGVQSPSLADGTVGTVYAGQVVALGVAAPATIVPLGALPPGLSMSSSGAVSGTPTTDGSYSFPVSITDASGNHCQKDVSITVNAAPALCADWDHMLWGAPIGFRFAATITPVGNFCSISCAFNIPPGGLMNVTAAAVQAGGPCNCNMHIALTAVSAGLGTLSIKVWDSTFTNIYSNRQYNVDFGPGTGTWDFPFSLPSPDTYQVVVAVGAAFGESATFNLTFTNIP